MSELHDQLRELLESGDTELLAARSAGAAAEMPDDPRIAAYSAFAALAEIIRIYRKEALDLFVSTRKKGASAFLSKFFLGRDEFYTDGIHGRYYADLEKSIDSLHTALDALSEDDPLRGDLSAAAVERVLDPSPKERKEMIILLSSDDHFPLCLLPFCRKEDLIGIRDRYLAHYPRKDRLPNQLMLLREMEKLIKA